MSETKPRFIQLTDAEVSTIERGGLEVPHMYRAPSGYYFCDLVEYRDWRASSQDTSGVPHS
jgi:hypothetical protein